MKLSPEAASIEHGEKYVCDFLFLIDVGLWADQPSWLSAGKTPQSLVFCD